MLSLPDEPHLVKNLCDFELGFLIKKNAEKLINIQKSYEALYDLSQLTAAEKNIFGDNDPSVAMVYNNLAGVYVNQGNHEKGLYYYIKAYRVLKNKLGLKHPNTRIVYENMELAFKKWNPEGNFEQWLQEKMQEEE